MNCRYLLDTHVLARWLHEPTKLSEEQARVLRDALRRREHLGISAATLVEIGSVFGSGSTRSHLTAAMLLNDVDLNPVFQILPITVREASEIAAIGQSLRDPLDRTIVATARVHNLILVTSDQRIIGSKLVPVVE